MKLNKGITKSKIKVFDNAKINKTKSTFVKYTKIEEFHKDNQLIEEESKMNVDDDVVNILDLTKEIKQVTSLNQLLYLIDQPSYCFTADNIEDLIRLKKTQTSLIQLNHLIGMDTLKRNIIHQVLFYCQHLHQIQPPQSFGQVDVNLMHTVIQGGPGCGKTTVAKIIGQIYYQVGVIKKDTFITVKRKDLIGEVLGQTAIKTTEQMELALGGVLFIDEAYSLGNEEKRDIFSKECI